jgi:predicted patatin/cPLA2 family phospholipase
MKGMKDFKALLIEVPALLGISVGAQILTDTSAANPTGEPSQLMSIIAQALVIFYTLIRILQAKPIKWGEVLKLIANLMQLIAALFSKAKREALKAKRENKNQNTDSE